MQSFVRIHCTVWLYEVKKFQANTLSSYCCALIKSMKFVFDIGVTTGSFFLQRPPRPPREPQWCLDMVLKLKTDRFCQNPSFDDLAMRTAFF